MKKLFFLFTLFTSFLGLMSFTVNKVKNSTSKTIEINGALLRDFVASESENFTETSTSRYGSDKSEWYKYYHVWTSSAANNVNETELVLSSN